MRVVALAAPVALAALAGCAAPEEEEATATEDAALSALESAIGFDGAVLRLDERTLAGVDVEARGLEARGTPRAEIERAVSRRVLREARARGGSRDPGVSLQSIYDWDLLQLNGAEQTLCGNARLVCVRVLLAGFSARGASHAAYADGNVGGRIDAFRHTYWNSLMAEAVGEEHARAWGDAHENGYPENRATAKARILSDMDFHNNAEGRRIGLAGGDLHASVIAALEGGVLRAVRYDRGTDGVLVPSSECTEEVVCGQ